MLISLYTKTLSTRPDYMNTVINGVVNKGGFFAINTHTLDFFRGKYLLAGTDLPLVTIPERCSDLTLSFTAMLLMLYYIICLAFLSLTLKKIVHFQVPLLNVSRNY